MTVTLDTFASSRVVSGRLSITGVSTSSGFMLVCARGSHASIFDNNRKSMVVRPLRSFT